MKTFYTKKDAKKDGFFARLLPLLFTLGIYSGCEDNKGVSFRNQSELSKKVEEIEGKENKATEIVSEIEKQAIDAGNAKIKANEILVEAKVKSKNAIDCLKEEKDASLEGKIEKCKDSIKEATSETIQIAEEKTAEESSSEDLLVVAQDTGIKIVTSEGDSTSEQDLSVTLTVIKEEPVLENNDTLVTSEKKEVLETAPDEEKMSASELESKTLIPNTEYNLELTDEKNETVSSYTFTTLASAPLIKEVTSHEEKVTLEVDTKTNPEDTEYGILVITGDKTAWYDLETSTLKEDTTVWGSLKTLKGAISKTENGTFKIELNLDSGKEYLLQMIAKNKAGILTDFSEENFISGDKETPQIEKATITKDIASFESIIDLEKEIVVARADFKEARKLKKKGAVTEEEVKKKRDRLLALKKARRVKLRENIREKKSLLAKELKEKQKKAALIRKKEKKALKDARKLAREEKREKKVSLVAEKKKERKQAKEEKRLEKDSKKQEKKKAQEMRQAQTKDKKNKRLQAKLGKDDD